GAGRSSPFARGSRLTPDATMKSACMARLGAIHHVSRDTELRRPEMGANCSLRMEVGGNDRRAPPGTGGPYSLDDSARGVVSLACRWTLITPSCGSSPRLATPLTPRQRARRQLCYILIGGTVPRVGRAARRPPCAPGRAAAARARAAAAPPNSTPWPLRR